MFQPFPAVQYNVENFSAVTIKYPVRRQPVWTASQEDPVPSGAHLLHMN
jgi:hypothetical protein